MIESYKDLDEIRKMINVGNDFSPSIRKTNQNKYSIFFQLRGTNRGYDLIKQRRSDRPICIRYFSTSDATLDQVQKLGFKMVVIKFLDTEFNA
jgi:hypothetical protein